MGVKGDKGCGYRDGLCQCKFCANDLPGCCFEVHGIHGADKSCFGGCPDFVMKEDIADRYLIHGIYVTEDMPEYENY